MQKYLIIILVSLLLFSISSCSGRPKILLGEIPRPPEKMSQSKVQETFSAVSGSANKEGSELVKSGSRWNRIKKIVDKISKSAELGNNYPYPVYVAINNDPEMVNAYVANGNIVVVYSSLIDKVDSDAQLSAVLGHEIGHMLAKHHEDDTATERQGAVAVGSSILGTVAGVAAGYFTGSSSVANMTNDVTSGTSEFVGMGAFVRAYDRDNEFL